MAREPAAAADDAGGHIHQLLHHDAQPPLGFMADGRIVAPPQPLRTEPLKYAKNRLPESKIRGIVVNYSRRNKTAGKIQHYLDRRVQRSCQRESRSFQGQGTRQCRCLSAECQSRERGRA